MKQGALMVGTLGPKTTRSPLERLFKEPIEPTYAMLIIAVLVVFFFVIVEPWTVGGGETEITGLVGYALLGKQLLQRFPFWNGQVFYIDPLYWKVFISLGMFAGGAFGAIVSGDFKIRYPKAVSEWVLLTIGGLLMGIGIRFSFICNVSTFFGTATALNLTGYVGIIGIVAGGYVGAKIYARIMGV
ncbi:MAG: YeeE/YedE thiosulfate transporter family protein [Chloroflexota bacterium]